ncbi:MAG: ABC transporter substrate-binding protein [Chitinophagales bacterium]
MRPIWKTAILAIAALLLLSLALPAFAAEKPIRFAVIVTSLTGPAAKNGEYITNGVKMALDEINAKGGVKGRKLEAVFLDDQAKASEAINAVRKAIFDLETPVILGSDSSGLILASMPLAAQEKIPQLVSGTNVRITNQGVPTIFRIRSNDSIPARVLADYATKKGYKKIGIMYTNEDYGKGFMEETQKNLTRNKNAAIKIEACNLGDTDFTAQILSLKNAGCDLIMALGKEIELAKFLRQMRELGVKTQVFGGSTFGLDYVVELAGKAMEGVKIVTHFLPSDPDPEIQKWVKRYMDIYKAEPQTHAVAYYDATKILAMVMEKYGPTSEGITKGLKELKYRGVQSMFVSSPTGDLVDKQVIGEFKNGKWLVTDVLGD